MRNLIYALAILVIAVLVMFFVINQKNKYIEELENVISKQIKLESKRLDDLETKLSNELNKVATKKKELNAEKRRLNKGRPKIKIVKTHFTKEVKSNNIISDFANLDNKISVFEKGLNKLKKGSKDNE